MKFWKSLSNLIEETLPDWRDKFLSYKDLKKQLKLIYPNAPYETLDRPLKRLKLPEHSTGDRTEAAGEPVDCAVRPAEGDTTKEVTDFGRLLEDEVEKFNGFFVDKEEEYVIRWKELQDRVAKSKDSNEELKNVGREIVDLHGEMVLLENYSALNYTGLVKILKKYDKRSGALIRLPFIQKVLKEPFYTTDLLDKLVGECETMLDCLFSKNDRSTLSSEEAGRNEGFEGKTASGNKETPRKVPEELADIEHMESMYVKLTMSALRVLKEIRSGSSTVSVFSLPPLQGNPKLHKKALKDTAVF